MFRKPLVLSVGVAMASGVLVGAGATGASAASSRVSLGASATAPWPGEVVRLSGRATVAKRTVVLQKRVGSRWVTAARTRTKSRGAFVFVVRATSARTSYRVTATKIRIKRKTYKATSSASRTVQARRIAVSLSFDRAPVGTADQTPGHVRISPVRATTSVIVQRRAPNGWVNVKSGTARNGVFDFQLKPGSSVYRAAVRAPGASVWTFSAQTTAPAWKLAWQDDFSNVATSSQTWLPREVGLSYGNRLCSSTGAGQAYYPGGGVMRLRLSAAGGRTAKCPHGTYLNAYVDTARSKEFVHGIFAARVKFQAPRGMHGAFWLQSTGSPEIDVVEYFGDGSLDGLTSYLHPRGGGPRVGGRLAPVKRPARPAAGYHVYSVEWTSAGYVFRIDGVETMRTAQLKSNDPHYAVLSLVASDWELPSLDRSKLSQAYMDVDWVRVYQP